MDSADSTTPARSLVRLSGEVTSLAQALVQRTPHDEDPSSASSPQVTSALAAATPSPSPPPVSLDRHLPETFSGEMGKCGGFLMQCSLQFRQLPHVFSSDGVKIAYFIQLLRDRALTWAQAQLQANPEITFADFLSKFQVVFDKGSSAEAAGHRLLNLKQGKHSMADYSVDFWTLATQTKCGAEALRTTMLSNINDDLKDELMVRELPASLESLCIQVDDRLRARRDARKCTQREPPMPRDFPPEHQRAREYSESEKGEEPMQLGHSRLSPAVRQRRLASGECLYCGRKGHFISSCPASNRENTGGRSFQ